MDGIRLHRGLTAGIRQVLVKQNYLNKINVFPVPDGDTGTNICFTLLSILDGTEGRVQSHAGRMAEAIADAALDGARGNSGVILAQFFQGFSEQVAGERRLSVARFAQALQSGHDSAYQALSEPKEGTILSVIRASAETLRARARSGMSDFHNALEETLEGARIALKKTPEQLAILKKSGVVDAGGQGFVYILRGITDFITSGSLRAGANETELPTLQVTDMAPLDVEQELTYRYCTECMVVGEGIALAPMRKLLVKMGDSLVLGGSKSRAKVHIHSDQPQQVFDALIAFGTLEGQKVDDMKKQVEISRTKQGTVAIVTDSTADIPAQLIEEYDIHLVPARLSFGNTGYLDKVTITADEFYDKLANGPDHPQTSQPTPGDFMRTYQFLASHYESVISIHLPLGVSGTIQSAENATRRIPDAKITVVDGISTAVGLGLIVTRVARAVKEGKNHAEALAIAQRAIAKTRIFAAIKDLSYAVRGGRVKASRKRLADLLRATPILSVTPEGKVDMVGRFFGRKDIARGLAKWSAKQIDLSVTYDIFISHAQNPEDADRLAELLPEYGYRINQILITDTGTALGTHTGPGSLIIGYQPADLE